MWCSVQEIDKASMFEEVVGTSPALQTVLSAVSKVAPTDSTVLLTGQTGTGKELIARAIHRKSERSGRAFISVNCAAIPQSLIASELFGHEKGAFTGALQRHLGKFELAEGGTIFLDEIGELPPETQVALLRVLQEREIQRVGGTQPIRVNVRILAATNRDLQKAIAAGTFREDLFYRLNVFPIHIPPLRERKEDIPMLVEYFIDRFARKAGKNIRSIDKQSLELLESYSWPGNIRELQNVVERSVVLCDTDTLRIDSSWLSLGNSQLDSSTGSLAGKIQAQEKDFIEKALDRNRGQSFWSFRRGRETRYLSFRPRVQDSPIEDQQAPIQEVLGRKLTARDFTRHLCRARKDDYGCRVSHELQWCLCPCKAARYADTFLRELADRC